MKEVELIWRERTSKSEFVASVWTCSAPVATMRTALADPCVSISLVRKDEDARVILRGPATKPRSEHLTPGYTCTTIRLRTGVFLRGFSAQKFINSSLVLPADTTSQFWFEEAFLQFPDFDHAELLIDQLYGLGYLSHDNRDIQAAKVLSPRTYSRLVKRATGLSPYRLHQLQRIHHALRLLKRGVPASMVAAELDFVDQAHLTHTSKQFLGHTPKQLLRLPQNP
jgi:AraC-like DNA-binding protein